MPRPRMTPQAESDDLPEGAHFEWGVRSPQGVRQCEDEGQARFDLVWLTESWRRTPQRRHPETQPMLVRRVVMPWEDIGKDYGPKVL